MIRIIVGVNLGLTGLLFYLLFELHKVVEQLGVSLDFMAQVLAFVSGTGR